MIRNPILNSEMFSNIIKSLKSSQIAMKSEKYCYNFPNKIKKSSKENKKNEQPDIGVEAHIQRVQENRQTLTSSTDQYSRERSQNDLKCEHGDFKRRIPTVKNSFQEKLLSKAKTSLQSMENFNMLKYVN